MKLALLWVHVLGVVVWLGGVMYQAHVLMPRARRGDARVLAEAAAGARAIAWTALALTVLTGLYHVTRLGPLDRVMQSGAAQLLAGKFALVLIIVALAGQRDFALVPRLSRVLDAGEDPAPVLGGIAWVDRVTVLLGAGVIYLGLAISRS
jgi:uncharacterized membrane protein